MALVSWTKDMSTVTKTLSVRYRRPLPLSVDVDLDGWGERTDRGIDAHGTMSADGVVCVEVEAKLVVYPPRR